MYTRPTVADFKAYFTRDFPYGATTAEVMDSDITKAFGQTELSIPERLFDDQASFTIGYLFLAAHWLVTDLRMSSQGIAGKYQFLEASKSVGSVSVSAAIPDSILKNPVYSMYVTTNYGAKYLLLLLPQLVGNMFVVGGRTLP